MGNLFVTEFMTLDGATQAPGGRDEDRDADLAHGAWQVPVADPSGTRHRHAHLRHPRRQWVIGR